MRLFIAIICFLLLACSSSQKEIPEMMLSEQKMVSILTDVHLLKGKISVWRLKQEVSQQQEDSLLQDVFKKHQLTAADFDSSLSYYSRANAKVLEAIYTQVVVELQEQEADLEN